MSTETVEAPKVKKSSTKNKAKDRLKTPKTKLITFKGTVKEFADKFGVSTVEANGLIKGLHLLEKAKIVGEGPKPARGRTPSVYEFTI